MPLVYLLALLAAGAGLLKLGALAVLTQVLWLVVIAITCLAASLAAYAIYLRRQRR